MIIKRQDPRSLVRKIKQEQTLNATLSKNIKELKTLYQNKKIESEHLKDLLKREIETNQKLNLELESLRSQIL